MSIIFKVGDRIHDYEYGWGDIKFINVHNREMEVGFDRAIKFSFKSASLRLSFKEYTLKDGGFSQERPKPEIEATQVIYVKNRSQTIWRVAPFKRFQGDQVVCFDIHGGEWLYDQYSIDNPLNK